MALFFNINPPRVRKGDTIRYAVEDGDGQQMNCTATVTGHGWHKGSRIVFLDDGTWCYRHHIIGKAPGGT
jgi:hypothetical protein